MYIPDLRKYLVVFILLYCYVVGCTYQSTYLLSILLRNHTLELHCYADNDDNDDNDVDDNNDDDDDDDNNDTL